MKRIITSGAILLGSLISFNAMAQDLSMEDAEAAVEDRQAVFKLLSFSNAPLGQMARGQMEFDLETAVQGAERVAMLAGMIPEVVGAADTSGMEGLDTRAFDSIWENMGEFEDLASNLEEGANNAIEILNDQGADGVRAAVMEIGPNCGACHDRFRAEE